MTDKQLTWADFLYLDPTPVEFDADDEYYYMSENMQGQNPHT